MNRPGRDIGLLGGYGDEHGFQVTFSDSANSDFHVYRESLPGGSGAALAEPLVGNFQPDGRVTDPADVDSADPRVGQLSDFHGRPAERTFTLFAADISVGASHRVDRWSLSVQTAIPEPSATSFLLAACCAVAGRRSR